MASSLRALAKGYAAGQIEKSRYRSDRTAFIEAVLSGAVSIRNQHPADQAGILSSESRVKNLSDKTTLMGSNISSSNALSTDEPSAGGNSGKKTGIIIGIAAAVVLVIIVAVTLSGGKEPTATTATVTASQPATDSTAQIAVAASPAVNLVKAFLSTNNWSQPSIDNFLSEWSRLSAADKAALAGSIELGQLTNAIYKKLLEERALSGIGNPETSYEKQRVLVDFAGQIGINDSRFALPEPPPAPTTP